MIFLTTCLQFFAQSVTPEEASQVAENFLYQSGKKLKSYRVHSKLEMTHTEEYLGHPIFYVFNSTEHDGFILVSANRGFYPVLGFSHRGSFDQDDLPPGLSELLDTYKKQVVESIRSDTIPSGRI